MVKFDKLPPETQKLIKKLITHNFKAAKQVYDTAIKSAQRHPQ